MMDEDVNVDFYVWLLAFIICALLMVIVVYKLVTLSDGEMDFLNPVDLTCQLNGFTVPEYLAHFFLCVIFFVSTRWFAAAINAPLMILHASRLFDGSYSVDVARIYEVLPKQRNECYQKFIFYLLTFVYYVYSQEMGDLDQVKRDVNAMFGMSMLNQMKFAAPKKIQVVEEEYYEYDYEEEDWVKELKKQTFYYMFMSLKLTETLDPGDVYESDWEYLYQRCYDEKVEMKDWLCWIIAQAEWPTDESEFFEQEWFERKEESKDYMLQSCFFYLVLATKIDRTISGYGLMSQSWGDMYKKCTEEDKVEDWKEWPKWLAKELKTKRQRTEKREIPKGAVLRAKGGAKPAQAPKKKKARGKEAAKKAGIQSRGGGRARKPRGPRRGGKPKSLADQLAARTGGKKGGGGGRGGRGRGRGGRGRRRRGRRPR